MKKRIDLILTSALVFLTLISCHQPEQLDQKEVLKNKWIDSTYQSLSLKQKVGQLFHIATFSNLDQKHYDSIQRVIEDDHIGGLIFFQGGPVRQVELINRYQSVSKVPLLIAMDLEWGLDMRLDSTFKFPYHMTLGAVQNDELIYEVAKEIAIQCKKIGVHMNYAPVVDINTNPNNPIIGVRSFGETKENVARKSMAFLEGLQAENILAAAKHFPGHGDTSKDSHKTLPTVNFSKERIDSVELYPYRKLIEKDLSGVMVAHLNVPSLDTTKGLPTSLNKKVVTDILIDELKFKGLIMTDALNMKGAANFSEPGEIDLQAFKAGHDLLLYSEDPSKAINKITEAIENKTISEERLAHSVKKILAYKYDVGLSDFKPLVKEGLIADLNSDRNDLLYKKVAHEAITLVKNEKQNIPLKKELNYAYIALGDGDHDTFFNELKTKVAIEEVDKNDLSKLSVFDQVIIGYHRNNSRITKQLSDADQLLIETIAKDHNTLLNVFASQYVLSATNLNHVETIVVSYENDPKMQMVSVLLMLGEKPFKGKLPALLNQNFSQGTGL